MKDVQRFLPQPGVEIFDPENMTREVLHQRLLEWLGSGHFWVTQLKRLRALVRELAGQPVEERAWLDVVPPEIDRLRLIRHDALSPVNRREAFRQVLAYVGLEDTVAAELLGHDRWSQVLDLIDAKCSDAPVAKVVGQSAVAEAADEWTRRVLATRLVALMDKGFFDICDLDRLDRAFQRLREQLGLPSCDVQETTQYAGLQALHCVDFKAMDRTIRQDLPAVVLQALGLDDSTGPAVLGPSAWASVRDRYANGLKEQKAPVPVEQAAGEQIADQSVPTSHPRLRWMRSMLTTIGRGRRGVRTSRR